MAESNNKFKPQLSTENRQKVIELLKEQGNDPKTYLYIANMFKISVRTVYRIQETFKKHGRVQTLSTGSSVSKYTEADRQCLRDLAIADSYATLLQLKTQFENTNQKTITTSIISKILKQFDLQTHYILQEPEQYKNKSKRSQGLQRIRKQSVCQTQILYDTLVKQYLYLLKW
ncbi:DDE_superfamily endonuclease domain-containing protein [Hexamita inflata]|uniref:DDE superfamily endonuclease domain-containing protein n=1 Tax=Hexamita inflata TaxID=28002 RepID=A0AA86QFK2_9EUKA|nr:DDE superfamily endonuclease domain-containing protein [Hexamita inflata]